MKEAGGTSEVHKTLLAFPLSDAVEGVAATFSIHGSQKVWKMQQQLPLCLRQQALNVCGPGHRAQEGSGNSCRAVQWEVLPWGSPGAHFSADPTWALLMASVWSRACDGLEDEQSWGCACEDLSVPSFFLTSLGIPKYGGRCTHREGILFLIIALFVVLLCTCKEQVLGLISSRFNLTTRKAKCAR